MEAFKYTYRVEWDEEDQICVARCLEFPSLAAHGPDDEAALHNLKLVVEDVLADLQSSGEPIPEPLSLRKYSGKVSFRMPREVHKKVAIEAEEKGLSINQLLLMKVMD